MDLKPFLTTMPPFTHAGLTAQKQHRSRLLLPAGDGCKSAVIASLITVLFSVCSSGCSHSEGYVEYSTLDRLPEKSASDSAEQWIVSPAGDDAGADVSAAGDDSPAAQSIETQPHDQLTPNSDTGGSGGSEATPGGDRPPADVQMTSTTDPESTSIQPAIAQAVINDKPPLTEETSDGSPSDDPDASAEPREIKLLVPEKRFRTEGDGDLLRISYDDIDLLQVLNMEPVPVDAVDYFPQWLNDLNGKRIRLRGFMFPTFVATGIKNFGLARDNGICCFVKQPKIYDMIEVNLAEGESTDYIEGKPFDVEGTFRIEPEADDTELFQLYRISEAKVLK